MFKDFAGASQFVKDHAIKMIDLKFSDLAGRWHHVTISASEFTPELMRSGVGFDGSSVGPSTCNGNPPTAQAEALPPLLRGLKHHQRCRLRSRRIRLNMSK